MYKKISDYGIIGNLRTIALIGLDGSCDWLCFPFIDSPFVFGALLDDGKGGRFLVRPAGAFDSTAHYEPGTNVLVTRFRTRTGILRLTDFMHIVRRRLSLRRAGQGAPDQSRQRLPGRLSGLQLEFK
jgi:GH15 family glucan-1,4-alpha-glucosidase